MVILGPSPRLKFDTIVSRVVQNRIQPSLLFFRTSPNSRGTQRFLRESCCINPPQSYTTCVRALQDLARSTNDLEVHFADEEADSYAVELAGRLGGYVLSGDSDFVIFATEDYLGYIPFDELIWNAQDLDEIATEAEPDDDDDFKVVRRSKEKQKLSNNRSRTSTIGIVPPEVTTGLTLSAQFYNPFTLASHLNLAVSLLPLLGAFVGNDYSKQFVSSDRNPRIRFFERQSTSAQRINHVATTLRSTLDPSSQKRRQKPVESVMELIERTVRILLDRSISSLGSTEVQQVVDGIVEATLPYTIPKADTPTSELWPTEICTLHEPDVCPILPIFSRCIANLSSSLEQENDAVAQRDTIRRLYITAYRKGDLSPQVMDVLNTASYWPKLFLESPDTATVSVYIGRRIREWGYSILEDAVGLPDSAEGEGEDNQNGGLDEDGGEDEMVDVVEESDEEDLPASTPDKLRTLCPSDNHSPETLVPISPSSQTSQPAPPKFVHEYVRRGMRLVPDEVPVPPLASLLDAIPCFDSQSRVPLQLRSDQERMSVLLHALQSDTALVRALPCEQLAVALTLRWVLQCAHSRAQESNGSSANEKEKWTRYEARSFLASFSWSKLPDDVKENTMTVPIENRNIQLMAQVLMALESVEHLSQILLLADLVPMPIHLFSGKRCHAYWTGVDRFEEDGLHSDLWEACTAGLEDGIFLEVKQKNVKKPKANRQTATVAKKAVEHRTRGGLFALLDDVETSI